nr:MAG TPA: hypothetical protein [Caudoviricetes sp.]
MNNSLYQFQKYPLFQEVLRKTTPRCFSQLASF